MTKKSTFEHIDETDNIVFGEFKDTLDKLRNHAFTNPATIEDSRVAGLAISRLLEHDWTKILDMTYAALEDGNHHDIAEKILSLFVVVYKERDLL
tara:strand:- start:385 stop:669 length:285 start_codon:yes stop_codon:yes gene_type:complete